MKKLLILFLGITLLGCQSQDKDTLLCEKEWILSKVFTQDYSGSKSQHMAKMYKKSERKIVLNFKKDGKLKINRSKAIWSWVGEKISIKDSGITNMYEADISANELTLSISDSNQGIQQIYIHEDGEWLNDKVVDIMNERQKAGM